MGACWSTIPPASTASEAPGDEPKIPDGREQDAPDGRGRTASPAWENGHDLARTRDRPRRRAALADPAQLKRGSATADAETDADKIAAFRQGAIDGIEAPAWVVAGAHVDEVAKQMSLTGRVHSVSPLMMSKARLDRLTPEREAALKKSAEMACAAQRPRGAAQEEKIPEDLRAAGHVAINEAGGKAPFREAMKPAYEQHRDRIGADRLDAWAATASRRGPRGARSHAGLAAAAAVREAEHLRLTFLADALPPRASPALEALVGGFGLFVVAYGERLAAQVWSDASGRHRLPAGLSPPLRPLGGRPDRAARAGADRGAGDLMHAGGLSHQPAALAMVVARRLHGGVGIVAAPSAMMFGAISGSAPATTAAIG